MKHLDARDTLFSRLGLVKGAKKYRDYYAFPRDLREEDDRVRESTHQTDGSLLPHRTGTNEEQVSKNVCRPEDYQRLL